MGGEPWFYFVSYQTDLNKALQELREREFSAGRYNPVILFPTFPIGPNSPSPGAKHASIQEALEASQEEGTRSILDIESVSEQPDYQAVCPLPDSVLIDYYATTKPTKESVLAKMDFFRNIERGQGIYIITFKDGKEDEILFAGVSFN